MDYIGPTLLNGPEIARAASEALSADMKFEDISEYVYLLPTNMSKGILTNKPNQTRS